MMTKFDWSDMQEQEMATESYTFYGWDKKPGQVVVGEVESFSDTAGTDYDGNPCPKVNLILAEPSTSHATVEGTSKELPVDTIVTINCGQYQLKRDVMKLDGGNGPAPGDKLAITFLRVEKTANGRTLKVFQFHYNKIDVAAATTAATDAPF
jgi:hypothetical protein